MSVMNAFYQHEINKNIVEFPKLKIGDYAVIFESIKIAKKNKADQAKKSGIITTEQHTNMLLALLDSGDNIFEIINGCSNPMIARKILDRSWTKANKPATELDELLSDLHPAEIAEIAYGCVRRDVPPTTNNDADKDKDNQNKTDDA